jgi:hypothetical protein
MYHVIGGDKQEYGPSSAEEVREWIEQGRLNGESLAREEFSQKWLRLAEFSEFEEALAQQAALYKSAPPVQTAEVAQPRVLNVSDCLSRGWQLWMNNFALFFAGSFMVWTISMALQFLPLLAFVNLLLRGVLYGGLCLLVLKRLRGKPVHVNEVFSGFGPSFMQLVLVGVIVSLLVWIGFFFCIIPGIYLAVIWVFSLPAVADKQVEFWPAMEVSRKVVAGQWSKVFVLTLIAFLPTILVTSYAELKVASAMYESLRDLVPASGPVDFGAVFERMKNVGGELARTAMPLILASKVVLLMNLPFGLSALMCAYEDLLGTTSKRPD